MPSRCLKAITITNTLKCDVVIDHPTPHATKVVRHLCGIPARSARAAVAQQIEFPEGTDGRTNYPPAARQHRALAGRKREGAVCICKTVFFSAIPLIINEQYVPRKAVLYYFVLIYSCAHRTWGIWLMSSNNLPCLQWQIVYFSLSLSF